jgi:hypothetical protein
MPPGTSFTTTDLLAAASKVMLDANYQRVTVTTEGWDSATTRLFEDEYNVVAIAAFETCSELVASWPDAQGLLVAMMSQRIGQEEAKAWDGYLVLLSPGLSSTQSRDIEAVRYNTTRVRKLVATGEDFQVVGDVQRVLSALLPLETDAAIVEEKTALDLLPKLLSARGIEEETTRLLIEAFREQTPVMEQLHQRRSKL